MYDIADLYKAEITIPMAFDLAAHTSLDLGGSARRAVRDRFYQSSLLDRCVRDIQQLLLPGADPAPVREGLDENVVRLWDGTRQAVPGGTLYNEAEE